MNYYCFKKLNECSVNTNNSIIKNIERLHTMKIAMIISTPFPPEEGVGFHVYNISKKLIERGNSITVFTRGAFKIIKSNYEGINIVKVPFPPLPSTIFYPLQIKYNSYILNKLFSALKEQYDIIHLHIPIAPLINTNLPILTTMHGTVIIHRNLELKNDISFKMKVFSKYFLFPFASKIIKNSDIITTVSNFVANQLKETYGLIDIPLCGNGVDENLFKPNNGKSGDYLLYVGRLTYNKGIMDLVNAFERIYNEYSTKLVIVGNGAMLPELKQKISDKKMEDKIIFCGHKNTNELVKLYQRSTIFISPSHYESGPLTLLEAMSCGKPVISTNVGLAQECINNCKNGILIEPESVNDMRNAISYLLDNENLRYKLGKNARKTILNNYTWDIVVDNYEHLYKSICEHK